MASVVQDNVSARTVSIAATATNIVAHTFCRRIMLQENFTSAAGPTTDFAQKAPKGAPTEIIVLKGTQALFTYGGGSNGGFYPGQIVGSIRVLDVAGPVTFQQREDQIV